MKTKKLRTRSMKLELVFMNSKGKIIHRKKLLSNWKITKTRDEGIKPSESLVDNISDVISMELERVFKDIVKEATEKFLRF